MTSAATVTAVFAMTPIMAGSGGKCSLLLPDHGNGRGVRMGQYDLSTMSVQQVNR